jgi:hypothetical protein
MPGVAGVLLAHDAGAAAALALGAGRVKVQRK